MATKMTFEKFWPHYRDKHSNPTCRRLHFVGTSVAIICLYAALLTQTWQTAVLGIVLGYACAWVGHFFFEHNTPATFDHPWLSLRGDLKLWWQMLQNKE